MMVLLSACRQGRVGLALVSGLVVTLLAAPARSDENTTPLGRNIGNVGIEQHIGQSLPLQAPFRDETRHVRPLGDCFRGRPVIVMLVYYQCPMLCNVAQRGLITTLDGLDYSVGRDFDVVMISFDPRERPELAAAKKSTTLGVYGRRGADAGWHFLTGDAESIKRVSEAVGFRYVYDDTTGQFAHASGLVVVTPDGVLSRYFYGIDFPTRDLRLALTEASAGRLGSPVDQILLLCYHYDPRTGRYGLAIVRLLRVAGLTTVSMLGGFVALALFREHRARRAAQASAIAIPRQAGETSPGECLSQ